MRLRRTVVVATLLGTASAQEGDAAVLERIRREAFASTAAHETLVALCDRIGGRLSGSDEHARAVAMVAGALGQSGLTVTTPTIAVPTAWRRGAVHVRVTADVAREVPAVAAGWTPALVAPIERELLVDPKPGVAVDGRVVLVAPSAVPLEPRASHPFATAALVLIDAERPYALVPTGLATWAGPFSRGVVPAAFVAAEDAAWIRRRVAVHGSAQVAASGGGSFVAPAADVRDVVAELRGAGDDRAATVLAVVGLDSWDLGSGALADAAGVAVVLEAARILAGLDGRAQRTIRFAFLAGTAQGLGTAGYAARLDETSTAAHVAALLIEGGGGRLLGLHLDGSAAHLELAEGWFAPVRDLGVADIGFRESRTILPRALQARGIPAFAFVREAPELPLVVGSRADTPERVVAQDLQQAACVLATGLWRIANADGVPPRFAR